jgi:hypothetical protein
MAEVRLDFFDLDEDDLPDVCMKCGAPATARPVRTFGWVPPSARFLPVVMRLAFMKSRRAPVPLCEQHKHHWTIRVVFGLAGLALILPPLLCGGVLIAVNIDRDPHGPLTVLGIVVMVCAGLAFLAWITALVVLKLTEIGAAEITDEELVLKNVSPAFAQAYREQARRQRREAR